MLFYVKHKRQLGYKHLAKTLNFMFIKISYFYLFAKYNLIAKNKILVHLAPH